MGYYFEDRRSMYAQVGMDAASAISAIARRYIGQNPPHPLTYRAFRNEGILRGPDYRYRADFAALFPEAGLGSLVYAWARYWADRPGPLVVDVTCFGPMAVFCNGKPAFTSGFFTERHADARTRVTIPLEEGWNQFVIRFKKTRAGFGGAFGSWLGKHPYIFMMPTPEREGQEGWIFTEPRAEDLSPLPRAGDRETGGGIGWHPRLDWTAEESRRGQLFRMFGNSPGAYAVGWTKAFFTHPGTAAYRLAGSHAGPIKIFIADREVFSASGSGKIAGKVEAPFGIHDMSVQCGCRGEDWGFELSLMDEARTLALESPREVSGASQPWLYAGPFSDSAPFDQKILAAPYALLPAMGGDTFWRLDMPDTWVRLYNENPLFGHWNYPLGVIQHGLLAAAGAAGSGEIRAYVAKHMELSTGSFRYALWDKKRFGGATAVHHLLSSIDSLDDCGSFGSALLEAAGRFPIEGFREIADYVAEYISRAQARLPDGTFFRKKLMHVFHENTLWADDLYMSVPFLCRYYTLTGDKAYIDDAARQFIGFKERLFIPEWKLMSHVHDLTRGMATGVPWGRGNGWTIFSLSELLERLPQDHPMRRQSLGMFRELCEGYLAVQDRDGMWHQVLNHPDSYPETSCTSMFTYAFARGVRFGWLEKTEKFIEAAFKAWGALMKTSVDREGNVYGVCRGSEFSFDPEYYKKELSWNLNDTHGIGIVLLAGVEMIALAAHLAGGSTEAGK